MRYQHSSRFDPNALLPFEVACIIADISKEEKLAIFNALTPPNAVATFEFLPLSTQKEVLYALPSPKAAAILNAMSPDDRTSFLAELPSTATKDFLKLLSPEERTLTLKLLGYPPNSVGRLMTPDYIAIHMDWTVQQVLKYIRTWGRASETIDVVYAVDDQHRLLDDFHLRELLISPPHRRMRELADDRCIALHAGDDQETAVNIFRKNGRVALPVVDPQGVLLGIVTLDDILNVISAEFTEDIQKVGGTTALDGPYMETPFLSLMKKRAGWLVILFLSEMFTATAMSYFEGEISRAVVLALFLPLIISSGGNSGSQASTLIVRALALEEIYLRDWWRVFRREIASGAFLGAILGAVGFLRITLWSAVTPMYGPHWLLIACTVCCSLIGVVLWGSLIGAMLPLALKRLGFDPATSSAPFVATLVDVTGIVIYFSIAIFFLSGTLL